MKHKGLRPLLILLETITLLLFAHPALPLTVEGEAVVSTQRPPAVQARDRALAQALRSAVMNAAERLDPSIKPSTLEGLAGDDHLSYVRSYRIVYELSTEDSYRLTVEAEIDALRLRRRLRGLQPAAPVMTGPKPSVSIAVSQAGGRSKLPTDELREEIASVLAAKGYRIVRAGDIRLNAIAEVKTRRSAVGVGRSFYHWLITLTMSATGPGGSKLAESRESTYEPGVESPKPSTQRLRELARASTLEIAEQLEKRASPPTAHDGSILLAFNGIRSYLQFEKLDSAISKSLLGVDSIRKRTLSSGRVEFEVSLNIEPRELAQILDGLELGSYSLRLEGVYPGRIEYSLLPKGL